MKTLLGVLGPSARHYLWLQHHAGDTDCEGRGAKRCGHPHRDSSPEPPWRLRCEFTLVSQMPKFVPHQLCRAGYPCRSGEVGLSASFFLLPGPPVHTQPAFPGGGGRGKEWMGCWDSDSEMLLLVCWFCWVTPCQGTSEISWLFLAIKGRHWLIVWWGKIT